MASWWHPEISASQFWFLVFTLFSCFLWVFKLHFVPQMKSPNFLQYCTEKSIHLLKHFPNQGCSGWSLFQLTLGKMQKTPILNSVNMPCESLWCCVLDEVLLGSLYGSFWSVSFPFSNFLPNLLWSLTWLSLQIDLPCIFNDTEDTSHSWNAPKCASPHPVAS